ncbi:Uncharacterised protein r2_g2246 [Pycnogonum litorale]
MAGKRIQFYREWLLRVHSTVESIHLDSILRWKSTLLSASYSLMPLLLLSAEVVGDCSAMPHMVPVSASDRQASKQFDIIVSPPSDVWITLRSDVAYALQSDVTQRHYS